MFARVTTAQGAPEKLDTGITALREGLRANQGQIEGLKGAYLLVDRAAGKHVTVTLWETREQAKTVSELPAQLQGSLVEAFGIAARPVHEIFEVAIQP
jgi:hypothetical protein